MSSPAACADGYHTPANNIQSFRCTAATEKTAEIYQQNILCEQPLVTATWPVARRGSCDVSRVGDGPQSRRSPRARQYGTGVRRRRQPERLPGTNLAILKEHSGRT